MVQQAPRFLVGTNAPPPSFESGPTTVIETGSASAPARPTPALDIMEGLITRVIDQFLSIMEYCTELVLFGQSFFEFVRSLLENHIENIQKVEGSEQAKVYQARMEQLGSYSVDLRS